MPTRVRVAAARAPVLRTAGRSVIAAGLAGAALAGCANGRVSDQDTARGTVETFLAQCAAGRGTRVLETLNRPARTVLLNAGGTRAGCNAILARGARPLSGDALRAATPRLTRFDGTTAEFAVDAGAGGRARVVVSRGAEGWRIEGPW
jgi:hypothetical protein